jgi:hypothetical protein
VTKQYPDLTEIWERKARARRANAALPFHEKLRRLDKLRERQAAFKAIREARKRP